MTRFNPLDHPIAFQFPLRNSPIADWWGHVPLASVLIDILRPKLFVELGVYRGDSFSAFCQAVQTLKLPTRCVGIDAWIGDENTGDQLEDHINELFAFVERRYATFASLRRALFSEVVNEFQDNTIDLLHIDGCHREAAVWDDYDTYLPKLSDHGLVVFHDIALGAKGGSFGVDAVWKILKARHPGAWFEFAHSWGLGLLSPKLPPDSMLPIFSSVGTDDEAKIQTYFQLLGARNFISMLYRRSHSDRLLVEGINHPCLSSDPSGFAAGDVSYTFDDTEPMVR